MSARPALSDAELAAIRAIGDNSGCMALKGASSEHAGPEQPDRWDLDGNLLALAARWSIDPGLDLVRRDPVAAQSSRPIA